MEDTIGYLLDTIGLGTRFTRAIFGAIIGIGIAFVLRPSLSFYAQTDRLGNPTGVTIAKSFAPLVGNTVPDTQKTTFFHYTMWPIVLAFLFSEFI